MTTSDALASCFYNGEAEVLASPSITVILLSKGERKGIKKMRIEMAITISCLMITVMIVMI